MQTQAARRKTPPTPVLPTVNEKHLAEFRKTGERLLSLALMQPKLRTYLEPITEDMLVDENAKKLVVFLKEHLDFSGTEGVEELRPLADYVKILSLEYEELYQDLELTELQFEAARRQAQLVDQYVKMQKPFLDAALSGVMDKSDDNPEKQALRKKIEYLNTLRNTYKRGV